MQFLKVPVYGNQKNFENKLFMDGILWTAPLPIHKVMIIIIFQDGMNGVYFYFVNKLFLIDRYLTLRIYIFIDN